MKQIRCYHSYFLLVIGYIVMLTFSCKNEEDGTDSINFNPSLTYGSMTDQDGNTYKTVTIGSQTWMAENLRTTKYRNGDPILLLDKDEKWTQSYEGNGGYCFYGNNDSKKQTYGYLYNWFAAVDARNIAPTGWRLPTDDDWEALSIFLGGNLVAGGKLKESGSGHWLNSNVDATNETGFTALPGGMRIYDGSYTFLGYNGFFWSSTPRYDNIGYAWIWNCNGSTGKINRTEEYFYSGLSVRCIKN